MSELVPIAQVAETYGIQRKSIRQAARRHQMVAEAIVEVDGVPHVDTDKFDAWWLEQRDERMDKVRRGIGS